MALANVNFKSDIDGKNINDYCGKLDNNLESYTERIKKVMEILSIDETKQFSDDRFWRDIWNLGVCNVNLGGTSPLYSETNIALFLESCGSYILNVDPQKYNKEEESIVIYTDQELFDKAIIEENKLKQKGERVDNGFIILKKDRNYKKDTKIKINKSDIFKYEEITKYSDYREYLFPLFVGDDNKEKRKELFDKIEPKLKNSSWRCSPGKLFFLIQKAYTNTKDDMTYVKISKEDSFKFKAPLKDNGCPSWENLDMFDFNQVKCLLKVHAGRDLQNDLACIICDLNDLIKKINLNYKQRKILKLYRTDMTLEEIATELDMTTSNVDRIVNLIVKRIVAQYSKEYEDWYYLNIAKGEYKTCKRCGKTKLVSEFHKEGKGYKSICKTCRKEIREKKKKRK